MEEEFMPPQGQFPQRGKGPAQKGPYAGQPFAPTGYPNPIVQQKGMMKGPMWKGGPPGGGGFPMKGPPPSGLPPPGTPGAPDHPSHPKHTKMAKGEGKGEGKGKSAADKDQSKGGGKHMNLNPNYPMFGGKGGQGGAPVPGQPGAPPPGVPLPPGAPGAPPGGPGAHPGAPGAPHPPGAPGAPHPGGPVQLPPGPMTLGIQMPPGTAPPGAPPPQPGMVQPIGRVGTHMQGHNPANPRPGQGGGGGAQQQQNNKGGGVPPVGGGNFSKGQDRGKLCGFGPQAHKNTIPASQGGPEALDRALCPFYHKIGACRHGDQCSRVHNRPEKAFGLLLTHMYQNTHESLLIATEEPWTDEMYYKAQTHLEQFYTEVFLELANYGEVEDMVVVDNASDHMVGNLYVKYYHEESAARALNKLSGRFYGGKLIQAELSPVIDFREARCRSFHETKCNRGGYCNFMHIKHIPKAVKRRLVRMMYEDHPEYGGQVEPEKEDEPDSQSSSESEEEEHAPEVEAPAAARANINPYRRANSEERRALVAQWNRELEAGTLR